MNLWRWLLLLGGGVVMVFPLVWLLSTALKPMEESIFGVAWPMRPTLAHFGWVWRTVPFGRYAWNSGVVAGCAVVAHVLVCALAAFPLARLRFRGRRLIFGLIVATSMVPFQVTLVPLYAIAVALKLRNSYWGLMFPYTVSAFGVFLLRQAFLGVPRELEEAARQDGCSQWGVWWFVMLPAVRPALVTLAVLTFVAVWGDFLWPLMMVDRAELYTLPLGIVALSSAFADNWRAIAAASVMSLVPILGLYGWGQRYLVSTDIGAGLKG